MTQSREDLVNRALRNNGALPTGQAAAPEDYDVVDEMLEPVMSDLATRNIWQWGDPDQIDDDAFEHLAVLLANATAPDFGRQKDDQVRLNAEARLRALNQTFLSGQPQQTDYF
jgi:hypothetical protein